MPRALTLPDLPEPLPEKLREQLLTGRELQRRSAEPRRPPLPTALEPLDRLLAGGLPRGELVELVGRRSSGRFSAVVSALAAATGAGETAALVDLGDGLDPQAAQTAGAALELLLWVRPRRLAQALFGTELLLTTGFHLVILDLGHPPVPGGRGNEASWLRLARAAEAHDGALLVSSPYRVSGTAAAAVVEASGGRPLWLGRPPAPRLLAASRSRLTLQKLERRGLERSAGLRLSAGGRAGG